MSTNKRIRGRKLQQIRKRHMQVNPLCVRCAEQGRVTLWQELDHTVAMENNGTDTDDNRQGLCRECHRIKTAEDFGRTAGERISISNDGWPVEK